MNGKKYTTAVFPGTFNPFTIGHEYIVNEALKVFDKVIILFAINSEKEEMNMLLNRIEVKRLYENNNRVTVDVWPDLTYKYCIEHNACLIRGIRNTVDFEYEKSIDTFNQQYNVNTFFIITPPHLSFISSSLVRSLQTVNDSNWTKYIPNYNTKK